MGGRGVEGRPGGRQADPRSVDHLGGHPRLLELEAEGGRRHALPGLEDAGEAVGIGLLVARPDLGQQGVGDAGEGRHHRHHAAPLAHFTVDLLYNGR